jgi:UDP-N-acetylglucosamine--N-acetylmuramyl-(pentapeptide) pyrophosphoryl-undecaprenol N-acetylglucosamine transferase
VSAKSVDQQAVAAVRGMEIMTLPAVGWTRRRGLVFLWSICRSYRAARRQFAFRPPTFVLAMGGFTSAPPVLAGKWCGARTFLHESNTIPGRANRWLAPWVDEAFVYFAPAAARLRARRIEVTGMPVRPQFLSTLTAPEARRLLGLKPESPVLLVMGGSQGAGKINELALQMVPQLREAAPELQFLHLTGTADFEKVRAAYDALNVPAQVRSFCDKMGVALAAADVALSRAGASSLAELAARQLPAVLIPYPAATDNHQYFNARLFVQIGAARMVAQDRATAGQLAQEILELARDPAKRSAMRCALAGWHRPAAAAEIADRILRWRAEAARPGAGGDPKMRPRPMGVLN